MAIPDDPYFAGRILDKSGKVPGPDGPPPVLAWICVYAVNLIVPVWMGSAMTHDGGKVGMLIGIIVVFALGCRVCFVSRRAVLTVVYGGWIIALTQFAPILHIFAGVIGVRAALALSQETSPDTYGSPNVNTTLGGLIATVITGSILITAAVVLGAVIQWVIAWYSRSTIPRANVGEGEIEVI
jgi:hypothetical protein